MSDDQGAAAELAHADAELTPAPGPTCMMRGQFALYQRDNGTMEIFYDVGEGLVRKILPAAVVKMMSGNGPMAGMLRKAFGG